MNRREFLAWVGVGGIASSLPIAIAACYPATPQTSSSRKVAQTNQFRIVGTLAELDQKTQILNQQVANAPVLIVRYPTDPQRISAVNPTCTHRQQCTVAWQADRQAFVCPCHDAMFAVDGKLLQSPARSPLATYLVKVEQGNILVATGQGGDKSPPSANEARPNHPSRHEKEDSEPEDDERDEDSHSVQNNRSFT